jgi:rhodanese-related sulfurtransferase/peroxiredoxin
VPASALGLLSPSPLSAGTPAPRLSLTAENGAWIRLEDRIGQRQVVVVFLRHLDDTTAAWLQDLDRRRADLEEMDTDVVAVHTARTDRLREFKNRIGIGFPITYDPLAVEARGWKASGRLRPVTKNTAYVVDIDGRIAWSHQGLPPADDLFAAIARTRGVAVPDTHVSDPLDVATVRHIDSAEAVAFLEEENGGWLLLDVRTRSEFDADHAPMAVHIPVDELPQRASELGQTNKVLCICQAGGRSQAAAEFLVSIGGHDILNVMGGMSAWSGPRVTGGETA